MDMASRRLVLIRQHLIDPEICIRCNTCEATCPVNAITHDDRNYVVRADVCNGCMACISPCPTGSIDNWRVVPKLTHAYSPSRSSSPGTNSPAELTPEQLAAEPACSAEAPAGSAAAEASAAAHARIRPRRPASRPFDSSAWGATVPPWSAAHAYGAISITTKQPDHRQRWSATSIAPRRASTARRTTSCWISAALPFPVLEGQSDGHRAARRSTPTAARHVAAPVLHRQRAQRRAARVQQPVADGQARHRGPPGAAGTRRRVQLRLRPEGRRHGAGRSARSGTSFLMPNHPKSQHRDDLHRHRQRADARDDGVAPAPAQERASSRAASSRCSSAPAPSEELPYFGPLQSHCRSDFIDINLAFSRTPGQPSATCRI